MPHYIKHPTKPFIYKKKIDKKVLFNENVENKSLEGNFYNKNKFYNKKTHSKYISNNDVVDSYDFEKIYDYKNKRNFSFKKHNNNIQWENKNVHNKFLLKKNYFRKQKFENRLLKNKNLRKKSFKLLQKNLNSPYFVFDRALYLKQVKALLAKDNNVSKIKSKSKQKKNKSIFVLNPKYKKGGNQKRLLSLLDFWYAGIKEEKKIKKINALIDSRNIIDVINNIKMREQFNFEFNNNKTKQKLFWLKWFLKKMSPGYFFKKPSKYFSKNIFFLSSFKYWFLKKYSFLNYRRIISRKFNLKKNLKKKFKIFKPWYVFKKLSKIKKKYLIKKYKKLHYSVYKKCQKKKFLLFKKLFFLTFTFRFNKNIFNKFRICHHKIINENKLTKKINKLSNLFVYIKSLNLNTYQFIRKNKFKFNNANLITYLKFNKLMKNKISKTSYYLNFSHWLNISTSKKNLLSYINKNKGLKLNKIINFISFYTKIKSIDKNLNLTKDLKLNNKKKLFFKCLNDVLLKQFILINNKINSKFLLLTLLKSFYKKLSKISKSLSNDLINSLFKIRKTNYSNFRYICYILSFVNRSLFKKTYIFYSFIKSLILKGSSYLLKLTEYIYINKLSNSLNISSVINDNKKKSILNNIEITSRLLSKTKKLLNFRYARTKLLKWVKIFNKNLLLTKTKHQNFKKITRATKNKQHNFSLLKYKVFSYSSVTEKNKNDELYFLENSVQNMYQLKSGLNSKLNLLFKNNNYTKFEKILNNYLFVCINFFSLFKLNFKNKVYTNLNMLKKDLILMLELHEHKFGNFLLNLLNFILSKKNDFKIFLLLLNNFNVSFNVYLRILIKKYLLKNPVFKMFNNKYVLSKYFKDLLNKINWKKNVNVYNFQSIELFSINNFYTKYASLFQSSENERLGMMNIFFKIKNILAKYKKISLQVIRKPCTPLRRKFYNLIWEIKNSYRSYVSTKVNLQKIDYNLVEKVSTVNYIKLLYNKHNIIRKGRKFRRYLSRKHRNRLKRVKALSQYFFRKKINYFNLIFFWYLYFFNKIFYYIKVVLFRLWVQFFFLLNKSEDCFNALFKMDVKNLLWLNVLDSSLTDKQYIIAQQLYKFKNSFMLNSFNTLILRKYFIDFYRSKNILKNYFFKSIKKISISQFCFANRILRLRSKPTKIRRGRKGRRFFRKPVKLSGKFFNNNILISRTKL